MEVQRGRVAVDSDQISRCSSGHLSHEQLDQSNLVIFAYPTTT
ncbi:hypothetical protein LC55x_1981 [Lysobacter capsici]|nr:hypothetical protein LC55x_1981 [Lysobacter capsici]